MDFTEKNWMTAYVFILYLKYLRCLCPGNKCIGVIVDKASSHRSEEVIEWIKRTNEVEKPKIIMEFIESGMTSVYQPPDVVVMKPLKVAVRKAYGKYRNEIAGNFLPGGAIKVTREKLTQMILEAYDYINSENMDNPYIRRAFNLCGLNPYATEENIRETFMKHLGSLSLNSAYTALLEHHTAVDLADNVHLD